MVGHGGKAAGERDPEHSEEDGIPAAGTPDDVVQACREHDGCCLPYGRRIKDAARCTTAYRRTEPWEIR